MPLMNKDGTPYKLVNTNLLMKTQESWKNYVLHNMEFNKITFKLNKIKIEKKIDVPQEIVPQEIEKKEEVKEAIIEDKIQKHKIVFACLPAHFIDKKDSLYEENYREVKYGEKFTFEGFIFENIDLYIKIWCKVNVSPRSIIYPKNQEKRWWEIVSVEEVNGGYLLTGMISEFNPQMD